MVFPKLPFRGWSKRHQALCICNKSWTAETDEFQFLKTIEFKSCAQLQWTSIIPVSTSMCLARGWVLLSDSLLGNLAFISLRHRLWYRCTAKKPLFKIFWHTSLKWRFTYNIEIEIKLIEAVKKDYLPIWVWQCHHNSSEREFPGIHPREETRGSPGCPPCKVHLSAGDLLRNGPLWRECPSLPSLDATMSCLVVQSF